MHKNEKICEKNAVLCVKTVYRLMMDGVDTRKSG
jgi:hypothetical protein